jgi:hypothetical protein
MVHPLSGAKTRQLEKFMKHITEASDSAAKQAYTQPALVELGDLKSETLGATATAGDGTSA